MNAGSGGTATPDSSTGLDVDLALGGVALAAVGGGALLYRRRAG
ncbi:MAG TPA: hypothetical protein VIY28_02910 [Pseudonocardiaceae bacterium]